MTPNGDSVLDRVRSAARRLGIDAPGTRVVAGVSGGVDSVVLAEALRLLGLEVVVVHVNYGLRGEASDADEQHVRAFAEDRDFEAHVFRADARGRALADGTSVQAAARAIRYEHFVDVARTVGTPAVAIAHHADDQAETVLLNLLRGSGPEGLAGMPARRRLAPGIYAVRPLLELRRSEIRNWAEQEGLTWRDDASNEDLAYRRSRVRHRMLPLLNDAMDEDVTPNIIRSAGFMRAYVREHFRSELRRRFKRCALADGRRGLALDALRAQPDVWRSRIILRAVRKWAPGHARRTVVAELSALIEAQTGRRQSVGNATVWRERDALLFEAPPADHGFVAATIDTWGAEASVPGGTLRIERAPRPDQLVLSDVDVEYADPDRLAFPLIIRPWKAGDRMQPLGMGNSRNVSDVLTDARVPSSRRRDVLVVESGGAIVWLVGVRLSEAYRVGPDDAEVAKLSFIRAREPEAPEP